jgi:hypothetical protein
VVADRSAALTAQWLSYGVNGSRSSKLPRSLVLHIKFTRREVSSHASVLLTGTTGKCRLSSGAEEAPRMPSWHSWAHSTFCSIHTGKLSFRCASLYNTQNGRVMNTGCTIRIANANNNCACSAGGRKPPPSGSLRTEDQPNEQRPALLGEEMMPSVWLWRLPGSALLPP